MDPEVLAFSSFLRGFVEIGIEWDHLQALGSTQKDFGLNNDYEGKLRKENMDIFGLLYFIAYASGVGPFSET